MGGGGAAMSFGSSGAAKAQAQAQKEQAKATQAMVELGKQELDFSMEFFNDYVAPLLEVNTEAAIANEERTAQVFDLQFGQAQMQDDLYREKGLPAERRFYEMAEEFSQPEFAEREAALALGDVRHQMANQTGQLNRALAARGIDPSSPAAISAMADSALYGSLASAGAVNRARNAARDLGMALTADAANFGRGGLSGGLAFSQAATGSAQANQGVVGSGVGTATQGASVPMQGFQGAIGAHGQAAQSWAQANAAATKLMAAESQGMGQFFGTVIGAGLKYGLGGGIAPSDRRLKKNIIKIGELPNGLNLYEFEFLWSNERVRGVMADEVEKVMPEAVGERLGFKTVNYGMVLGV